MKILILHDETEIELPMMLSEMLEKKSVDVDTKSMEKEVRNFHEIMEALSLYSHFIVVNNSAGEKVWISLCIGFAWGAKNPVLFFGNNPPYLNENGSWDFRIIKEKKSFIDFLDKGFDEWVEKDNQKKAKNDLLDLGIPFNEESFERCVGERNSRAAELFIKAGFSPDARDKNGVPLLNLAARTGDRNVVRILLQAGAGINRQSKDRGSSALIDACSGKSPDIVRDLIGSGADVNLKSKDGQSALIIAVGLNEEDIVEQLLKAGANPDEPDALGASARKYATLFNKPAMVALFKKFAPGKVT